MNKLRALLLSACLAAPACASAGVVYEWRTFTTSSSIYQVVGSIELSDAAVQSGRVDYTFVDSCGAVGGCSYADPASPLMRFTFKVNHLPIDIDIRHGTGFRFGPGAGWLKASFDVGMYSLGPLTLSANDSESYVQIDGALITDANGDMLGCPDGGCNGATGGFFRVPEPASALLVGAGLMGMAGLRRRRRTRIAETSMAG